jgi:S-formylglutathione hydrolase FrmB
MRQRKNGHLLYGMAGLGSVLAVLWTVLASRAQEPPVLSRVEYRTFFSRALQQEKPYAVYLPPGYDASKRTYPVLYFLHGLFGTERQWEEKGGRALVDRLIGEGRLQPAIIAVPDGGNSFYVNALNGGGNYEAYIINDFIPHIEKAYRVAPGRTHRAITGLSMGGFGALMLAMRHPDRFSSASAHSAVLLPVPLDQLPERLRQSYQSQFFEAVFGNPVDEAYWKQHHPIDLIQTASGLEAVAWYFDCGTEDRYGFHRGAARLHEVMAAAGLPHEYHLFPGGHGWEYAIQHLPASLAFHSAHFEGKGER